MILLAGTAGAGKSQLTSSILAWYRDRAVSAISVNLDPGVQSLPYEPDVDIRETIDIGSVMDSYSLGPNGALILATDLIASRLSEIQEQIDSLSAEHVVVDTPGQIELFAFRESGPFIARGLEAESKVTLFLIDSLVANSPANFLSLAMLSSAVKLRLNLPQIPVLSKTDLSPKTVREIVRWTKESASFEEALAAMKSGEEYSLYSQLFRTLKELSFSVDLYPVSSYTGDGLLALMGEISRIAKAGEELED
jgi:GPN-loop GTPase